MDKRVIEELKKVDPSVPFPATTSYIQHTWAKTFYSRPELYIQPASIAEVRKVITLARTCRRRLVTVGSCHSPSDLTCTSSWMVNLDRMNRILSCDTASGIVSVEAGIRLRDLGPALEERGLMLPNSGSVNEQSMAGVISTGTHGSSLRYGLLSDCVLSISIMLANGEVVKCDSNNNQELFRAALISLGALGIIVEITLQAVPAFNVAWHQSLHEMADILAHWDSPSLWRSAEYVRVWWMPYMKRAILWKADKTNLPRRAPPTGLLDTRLGQWFYHNLLYLANIFPRIIPWIEWFIFGIQAGFQPGKVITEGVDTGRAALLMDCLYSQFVNEWAIPLHKGPEAISRLSMWLNGDPQAARIPFDPTGVWVHCPIEVRVSDTSAVPSRPGGPRVRPYLDQTARDDPTLYLNATLYRPYLRDPPCVDRYYEAFEWLMREMGGRPHWAKNYLSYREIKAMYGDDLKEFLRVRDGADPEGMFLGEWHRRNIMPTDATPASSEDKRERYPLAERERTRRPFTEEHGVGDAVEWIGRREDRDPVERQVR